mmetsp:Transcript_19560/g.32632  ORF Transcript_19560/g.32632 Transcript_19560/m.32632 type:complete len:199 (+) Transcript_19560:96-692(+)
MVTVSRGTHAHQALLLLLLRTVIGLQDAESREGAGACAACYALAAEIDLAISDAVNVGDAIDFDILDDVCAHLSDYSRGKEGEILVFRKGKSKAKRKNWELRSFCTKLLEEHKDALSSMLYDGVSDIYDAVCVRITTMCTSDQLASVPTPQARVMDHKSEWGEAVAMDIGESLPEGKPKKNKKRWRAKAKQSANKEDL